MRSALEGIRVADFSQWLAGPTVGMVLADLGADVVRVDPPGGPMWNHPVNAVLQRGKRSIVLDLKKRQDAAIAQRLIANVDVVIESFRPGVAERLGIGHAAALERNERVVYVSLPGFAAADPRASVAAWESVVAAESSVLPPREGAEDPTERRFVSVPVVSGFAAVQALHSVLAALVARERTGLGQWVEVPLFDAAFEVLGGGAQKVGNVEPSLQGVAAPATAPQIGHYRAADGAWIQLCLIQPRHLDWFIRAFLPEEVDNGWNDAARVATDADIQRGMRSRLETLIASRTAREWEQTINETSGAPSAIVQTSAEWMRDPHALETESVIELVDPELGATRQAGYAINLSDTPLRNAGPRRPLDADRDSVLADLTAWERVAHPRPPAHPKDPGQALSDVTIVDVSQVLAGPTVSRVLGEYGARTVKINSFQDRQHFMHTYTNNGKDSILVDLKTPEGKELLDRLLDTADVFVENFTRGVAERLGIGDVQLRAAHPEMIRVGVSAFGHTGYRGGYRGREELGQAVTGIQMRWFGEDSPRMVFYALNDYGAGNWGAVGTLAALFHRLRGGSGQRVHTSLSHNGTFLQLPYMVDFEGRTWNEPTGEASPGWDDFDRIYRAADRWFVVAAKTAEERADVLAIAEVSDGTELEQAFAAGAASDWVDRLRAAGIGAAIARTQEEVMEDPATRARGLSLTRSLDSGEPIRTVGPAVRLHATPVRPGRIAGAPGSGLDVVFDRLGITDRKQALVAAGAVLESLPDDAEFIGRFRPKEKAVNA